MITGFCFFAWFLVLSCRTLRLSFCLLYYRFFSMDEQLKCYCGSQRCRGVVNDTEAEEQAARVYVPCSELIDCKGE